MAKPKKQIQDKLRWKAIMAVREGQPGRALMLLTQARSKGK